jgi:hypothetical protein
MTHEQRQTIRQDFANGLMVQRERIARPLDS